MYGKLSVDEWVAREKQIGYLFHQINYRIDIKPKCQKTLFCTEIGTIIKKNYKYPLQNNQTKAWPNIAGGVQSPTSLTKYLMLTLKDYFKNPLNWAFHLNAYPSVTAIPAVWPFLHHLARYGADFHGLSTNRRCDTQGCATQNTRHIIAFLFSGRVA